MAVYFVQGTKTFLEKKTLLKQNKLLHNLFLKFKPSMIQLIFGMLKNSLNKTDTHVCDFKRK